MKTSWVALVIAGNLLFIGLVLALIVSLYSPLPDWDEPTERTVEMGGNGGVGLEREATEIESTPAPKTRSGLRMADYKLTGPYTHDNLTVFLIHGKDQLPGKTFLTLQEALEKKVAVVPETGNVNELAIENRSAAEEIFVQSGDIVQGGQQDRVIPYDYLVPPNSGRVPLASFCVEQGRWTKRGDEDAGRFGCSKYMLASKELKLAARYQRAQDEVWQKVADAQERLARSVGSPVRSAESSSSLPLSLENQKVRGSTERYLRVLGPLLQGHKDVIGYAFAINGKVNCAEVYASSVFFKKLWPRLLQASAVEALMEVPNDNFILSARMNDVKSCLVDAEEGKASQQQLSDRMTVVVQETNNHLLFETRDQKHKDVWMHRSYYKK
jgi:hypothetical protein